MQVTFAAYNSNDQAVVGFVPTTLFNITDFKSASMKISNGVMTVVLSRDEKMDFKRGSGNFTLQHPHPIQKKSTTFVHNSNFSFGQKTYLKRLVNKINAVTINATANVIDAETVEVVFALPVFSKRGAADSTVSQAKTVTVPVTGATSKGVTPVKSRMPLAAAQSLLDNGLAVIKVIQFNGQMYDV